MSFWLDAVLTSQYLRNRLPTSTLPANITPYESFTRKKPDLSHLRVWGCQCFVAVPDELRPKAGSKRFEAIFVGYEEVCIGWQVCDLKGKYLFSQDVILNEDLSGHLGLPHSLSDTPLPSPSSSRDHPSQDHVHTLAGQEFDEVLRLKEFCRAERERRKLMALPDAVDGGDCGALVAVGVPLDGDRLLEVGGDDLQSGGDVFAGMIEDGSLIEDVSV